MKPNAKPTATQMFVLRAAVRRPLGEIEPLPDHLRGGACVKVMTALLRRGLIESADDGHVLTDAGFTAIGQQRPVPLENFQPVDTIDDIQLLEDVPVRPGTKLAALVVALCRPEGATGLQLMLATGWQPHTVRGAISGMLRKKLGLNVVSSRAPEGERVYRIAPRTYPSPDQSVGGMSPD